MKKLSVILPCFNESKNLPYVLEKFGKVINSDDIELIIVDNGSEDNTLKILEELIPKYSFAKLEKVKVNKGYGYGIKSGLEVARGKYLSWTHADMQTDPNDVIKALNLIENCSSRDKLFIKGKRYIFSKYKLIYSSNKSSICSINNSLTFFCKFLPFAFAELVFIPFSIIV